MAHKQRRTLALFLTTFALCSILLAACVRPGTGSSGGSASTGNATPTAATADCPSGTTVKTSTSDFEQKCITLSKGSTLTIAQDQTSYHILDYGQWSNGAAQPAKPTGAPTMNNLTLSTASVKVGPFTTAGTFNIYCTVHAGMNLKVVVK